MKEEILKIINELIKEYEPDAIPQSYDDYSEGAEALRRLRDKVSQMQLPVMQKIVEVCKREIEYVRFCLNEPDYNEKFSIEDKAMLKERNKAYSQILQIVNNFSA